MSTTLSKAKIKINESYYDSKIAIQELNKIICFIKKEIENNETTNKRELEKIFLHFGSTKIFSVIDKEQFEKLSFDYEEQKNEFKSLKNKAIHLKEEINVKLDKLYDLNEELNKKNNIIDLSDLSFEGRESFLNLLNYELDDIESVIKLNWFKKLFLSLFNKNVRLINKDIKLAKKPLQYMRNQDIVTAIISYNESKTFINEGKQKVSELRIDKEILNSELKKVEDNINSNYKFFYSANIYGHDNEFLRYLIKNFYFKNYDNKELNKFLKENGFHLIDETVIISVDEMLNDLLLKLEDNLKSLTRITSNLEAIKLKLNNKKIIEKEIKIEELLNEIDVFLSNMKKLLDKDINYENIKADTLQKKIKENRNKFESGNVLGFDPLNINNINNIYFLNIYLSIFNMEQPDFDKLKINEKVLESFVLECKKIENLITNNNENKCDFNKNNANSEVNYVSNNDSFASTCSISSGNSSSSCSFD